MDQLIRAGGLYAGAQSPIAAQTLAPLSDVLRARSACATFYDADLVMIRGSYSADLVLFLPHGDDPDDEMEIQPHDLTVIVAGLERGEILVIHGFTPYAPEGAFFKHIEPLLGGGQA